MSTTLRTDLLKPVDRESIDTAKPKGMAAYSTTSVRISPKVRDRLAEYARAEKLSVNQLLNLLIDRYLVEQSGIGIDEIDPEFLELLRTRSSNLGRYDR